MSDIEAKARLSVRCARCGSDIEHEVCDACGGEGVTGHDCGEDSCCCLRPEPNIRCDYCLGTGGHWRCFSAADWCAANPLAGRETVASSTPEWFAS